MKEQAVNGLVNKYYRVDRLRVQVYPSRESMGRAAAEDVAERIRRSARAGEGIRMIFAAAASQQEFLEALVVAEDVPWPRVTAFHMDEYIGLPDDAPQRFGRFLRERLFERVPFGAVHYLRPERAGIEAETARYGALLTEAPIDICCMGIGENGHLAFNDPPVADFDDSLSVKVVELDAVCRQQQVNDGAFERIEDVPTQAVTLTIPALMRARHCAVVVPGSTKVHAVSAALNGPIATACPASILRRHGDATLYLDLDAAALLDTNISNA